tara:strand:+ start:1397 stop:2089 length:693 start_codon:yes stop_codon:yes gene_type:complete
MLAIIPARKGSKGLKNKNIKLINKKPLISYTIEAAIKSSKITEIFISTNDLRVIKIASSYNINTPFLRPNKLATDKSPAIEAYLDSIEKLNMNLKKKYRNFVVLLPTSPLRSVNDIDKAIEVFQKKKADSVISMSMSHQPIEWHKKISKNYKVDKTFNSKKSVSNRQNLEKTFVPNGSIYVFNYNFLKNSKNYYGNKTYAYIMPKIKSYDIDDKTDFEIVKKFLIKKNEK